MPYTITRYDIWDLNTGNVPEFPVDNPPGWDDVSLYYAKALQQMGWRNPADPTANVRDTWTYSETPNSYFFQAAMHWTPEPLGPGQYYWDHCTHGSGEDWFLAWHRAFIYWYEVIIRSYVAGLGGPADWALPYWNYSYYDAADPNGPWPRSALPYVFCQATLPDGTGNPLYMPDTIRRGLTCGEYLWPTTPYYNQAYGKTPYLGVLGFNQTLDNQPHGAVHVNVGQGDVGSPTGWMQAVPTAAFDPVFWLHHSEIDRFWVGWNANGGQTPSTDAWLDATTDPERGTRWTFWQDDQLANGIVVYPRQMLDPANLQAPLPYCYQYATLPQTPAPTPAAIQQRSFALGAASPTPQPATVKNSVLGAAENLALGPEPVSVPIQLGSDTADVLSRVKRADEQSPRITLHLENVQGPPGNYEVYLNYPDATYESAGRHPHHVGTLAGFGADHVHGDQAHGISTVFDITDLVRYLDQTGSWDPSKATVTFVSSTRSRQGRHAQGGLRVGNASIRSLSGTS